MIDTGGWAHGQGGAQDGRQPLRDPHQPAGTSKVSWQVTGIRRDAWAEAHRIPVEEDKPESERGHYLHPEAFGGERP